MNHKHEWILIDKSGLKEKNKSLAKEEWVDWERLFKSVCYIPNFDYTMLLEQIIDNIQMSNLPTFSSQTWACNCGNIKTHMQRNPSLAELLTKNKL